ncbi:hypothetical protein MBCUT_04750 [Methanobrevibacter cuticularis]|uniref:Uncharacterized protein n=1 Tax=Methanobrevibacter cuticularis TaxID=47311 RepID=A0A166ER97_9EURY|nr:hypothetical protein [Methanobrevibacter cuticularis]KZX16924.1 hypothetical protein MBCUT_04750 [Methanobrevibacter cuticularis]
MLFIFIISLPTANAVDIILNSNDLDISNEAIVKDVENDTDSDCINSNHRTCYELTCTNISRNSSAFVVGYIDDFTDNNDDFNYEDNISLDNDDVRVNNYSDANISVINSPSNSNMTSNHIFEPNTNDPFDVTLSYFPNKDYSNLRTILLDTTYNKTGCIILCARNQVDQSTIIIESEVQNFNYFNNPTTPQPTNITINSPKAKRSEIIDLIAKLTDQNNDPLILEELVFHIADKTIPSITDSDGIARILYNIKDDDFTNSKLDFTVSFKEYKNYLPTSAIGTIDLVIEPKTTPEKNINNSNEKSAVNGTTYP